MASVVPLGVLTPGSNRVRVRARILKVWDARRVGQMPFGKNFVLIDAEGGAIQGLILAIKYSQVATFFVEGRVCEFGRFTVRHVTFGCRTVSHQFSLLLNKDAMISDLGDNVGSIPVCYFELARLEDIGGDKFPKDAVMDVMGRLSGFAHVEHVMSKGVELRERKMYLTNERGYTAEISLWDNHVDHFDDATLASKSVVSPVIIGAQSHLHHQAEDTAQPPPPKKQKGETSTKKATGKRSRQDNTVTQTNYSEAPFYNSESDYLDCYDDTETEDDETDEDDVESDPDYDKSATSDDDVEILDVSEDTKQIISISSDSEEDVIAEAQDLLDSETAMTDSGPHNAPLGHTNSPNNNADEATSYGSPAFNTKSKKRIATRADGKKTTK